jgi:uncharacterized membrane protein
MQINNPFQINDWEIKKFFKVVVAIQLAIWGAIGLDTIGLQIPILRQFIGFIYLTFIPGIIIVRIVKLHKLGNTETLLYTVGLSIVTLMFAGLLMNTVYPIFGISGPISPVPLIITISAVVLFLCVLCYVRDKDFADPSFIDLGAVLSPPVLFLSLIPFFALIGTYLVNFHHNNILLMLLIILLAIIALLIAFDKFIPKNLYPLAVFIIAISLLYHRSLISMYIWGADIHFEHYLCNLVKTNAIWDSTVPSTYNAMLSIMMVAPIFSDICGMCLTWVFKVIYPLLFSLVPLGLYQVFQKQADDKIAFLSCFFFISLFTFYSEMLALARQQIAELFFVLLIMLMVNKGMDKIKRSFLFIVFGVSLTVSHYGTSYIYMFCLISAWLILVLAEKPEMHTLMNNIYAKFGRKAEKLARNPISLKIENRTIRSTFVLLFITFTLTWYMYVSASSAFNSIVHIGDHIASSIFTDFLNPAVAEGLGRILEVTVSPLHEVTKYIHLISQCVIVVGVATLMLNRKGMKFEREYEVFCLLNFVICFAAIAVPYFASAFNTTRLYHITLIFLAPFCVIGGIAFFKALSRANRASWTDQRMRSLLKVLSVFLVIFLLFNSGWVYEVAKDHPTSISLSQESIKEYGDAEGKVAFYNSDTQEQDVFGAWWLSKKNDNTSAIYTDGRGHYKVVISYGMLYGRVRRLSTTTNPKKGYIYLNYLNVVENLLPTWGGEKEEKIYNTTEYPPLEKGNKIYSNGGSEIYWI